MTKKRELNIVRQLPAKPAQVFQAWTEPERFQHWWGGTGSTVPLDSIEMDVRPGGRWQATIKVEGGEHPFHGIYREVVPGEKLVFSLVDPNDADFEERSEDGADEEAMTVVFTEAGGGTELRFTQGSDLPESELQRSRDGMNDFFDKLAAYLAKG